MATIPKLLNEAVQNKTAPGIAAAIVSLENPEHAQCYFAGQYHAEEDAQQVGEDAIFDLASLTKIMCTGVLIAQTIADGRLSFDTIPFPKWPHVTLRHLLLHNSGLPAWKPFIRIYHLKTQALKAGNQRSFSKYYKHHSRPHPARKPPIPIWGLSP